MMRILLLFFLFISCTAVAQVSMENFLLAAWEEPAIKSFAVQDNFLNSRPYQLAPLQKLEFRSKSNQLDLTRQNYALRFTPANPWEIKRTNQYFKTYQEVLQLDKERMLKEALAVRYQTIIDWLYHTEIKTLREEDKQAAEKLILILEAQRFSGFFDGKDYVDMKLKHVEKAIELEEAKFEIDNQRNKIESLYNKARGMSINWGASKIISITKIESIVDSLKPVESKIGEIAYRQKKIDLANREWQLEKSNINVGFVQTEYEKFRIEQNRRPWSISMGLTIPIFNPNKGDMTKRKLEGIEAQGALNEAEGLQRAGQLAARSKIKSLIARYHEIDTLSKNLKLDDLAENFQQLNDSNPAAMVRVQNNQIKLKTMHARLKQEILLAYIEFLSFSERLQAQPLLNYLSENLNVISQ